MVVNIIADLNEAKALLEDLKEDKYLQKNLLTTAAQKTRQKVRSSYGAYLNKKSGTLYKSIKYKVAKSGSSAAVYSGARYGFALAHGYEVLPKNEPLLTFNINGKWVKTYGPISVSSKNFVEDPGNAYLNGQGINHDLEERMQKEVERIEKKASRK